MNPHEEAKHDPDLGLRLVRAVRGLEKAGAGDRSAERLPSTAALERLIGRLRALLYPPYFLDGFRDDHGLHIRLCELAVLCHAELRHEIAGALRQAMGGKRTPAGMAATREADRVALALLEELPAIRRSLDCDLQEVLDRDPAAADRKEVILAYPGFEALTVHRLAHFLHDCGVPLVPRMMSEIVHRRTGIDIHPAARIGSCCSIDHGTGLVIGETSVIGRHVSLYHEVTLGARSVRADMRGAKRHPTIGDDVIIYPGATILGDIEVGSGSVIGGNVVLMESCPPNTTILAKPPETVIRPRDPSRRARRKPCCG